MSAAKLINICIENFLSVFVKVFELRDDVIEPPDRMTFHDGLSLLEDCV